MQVCSVAEFLAHPPASDVCVRNNEVVSIDVLRTEIFSLREQILQHDINQWILSAEDSWQFAKGFFALLAAGKSAVLPPNNQVGAIENILTTDTGLISTCDRLTRNWIDINQTTSGRVQPPEINIDPESQYIDLWTSGSSGEPKLIHKKLSCFEEEVECIEQLWGGDLQKGLIVSSVSHLHIYGILFRVLWPILTGRLFVIEDIEYPEHIVAMLESDSTAVFVSSPAFLKRMVSVELPALNELGVKQVFSSGGPLEYETAKTFNDLHGIYPNEVFGSTETGGIAHRQQQESNTPWQPMSQLQLREREGVLELKSPFCFSEGWYQTSDRVQLFADGRFQLLGRADRIIKLEEKKVSLDQMENLLQQSPLVEMAKVVLLEGHRTMLGVIAVLTERGQDVLEENGRLELSNQLKSHLKQIFEPVTLPRKWRYIDAFQYNQQGKIPMQTLLDHFKVTQGDEQTS